LKRSKNEGVLWQGGIHIEPENGEDTDAGSEQSDAKREESELNVDRGAPAFAMLRFYTGGLIV
jgi:hypothetical protein